MPANVHEYGPFANVVLLAGALVATFAFLFLKMLGRAKKWAWLTGDTPSFMVKTGPRIVAVGVIAATYITINKANYGWFCAAAILFGVLGFIAVWRFDLLLRNHIQKVPLVGADGQVLRDDKGQPQVENVVIGTEAELRPEVRDDLMAARAARGGLSLGEFMSGYGGQQVNNPEALWDRAVLSRIGNQLTLILMLIFIFAVLALFLAAFAIDVSQRPA